ncbi:MAG TPA: sterol desaturase [Alphaproteobacteria bacterium]|nr:sterol desaturase [Alphaproteobacteria bacterium]|tara:strand:- start:1480 stop:2541 length:1062 start_codon:yes stop_codon:yes gene_type:complete
MDWLFSYAGSLPQQFIDPGKRLFIGYLISALLIAVVWIVFVVGRRPTTAFAEVFSPKIWFSRSSQLDLKLFVVNRLVFSIFRPALFTQLALAGAIFIALHDVSTLPKGYFEQAPAWAGCCAFSISLFLLDDFTRYFLHRLLHRWPVLWAFHKLHHSAETLTPLTIMRTHPVEGVLFATRSAFVQGLSIGSFVFLFGDKATLATVFGVNGAVFAFHVLGSNLRHSHVWIAYPAWLEHILISPAQHQIHHSDDRAHFDRNFGVVLSVWDWLGGSLHLSCNASSKISFGLGKGIKHAHKTLLGAYSAPFMDIGKMLSGGSSTANRLLAARYATTGSQDIRTMPGRQRYRHGEGGLL